MLHVRKTLRSEDRQKKMTRELLKLYLVLETKMLKKPLDIFIDEVVKNGVTAIQLRDKGATARERYETGLRLVQMLSGTGVFFVVNDRLDIARAVGCGAVHLGVKDIPLKRAKEISPHMLYGYSCNCEEDIEAARQADYIGVGPAFMTGTKADLRPAIGVDGIAKLVAMTNRPAVVIGGINESNILQFKGIGLAGVAVSSCICASEDPAGSAARMRELAEQL